jgi:hypothetical protein
MLAKMVAASRRTTVSVFGIGAFAGVAVLPGFERNNESTKYVFSGAPVSVFVIACPTIAEVAEPKKAAVITTATAHTINPWAVSRK